MDLTKFDFDINYSFGCMNMVDVGFEYLKIVDISLDGFHNLYDHISMYNPYHKCENNIHTNLCHDEYHFFLEKILQNKYNISEDIFKKFIITKKKILRVFCKFVSLTHKGIEMYERNMDICQKNYNYISKTIFNNVVIKYSDDELINLSKEQIKNIMIAMCKTYNDNKEFYDMWLNKKDKDEVYYIDLRIANIYEKKITLTNL